MCGLGLVIVRGMGRGEGSFGVIGTDHWIGPLFLVGVLSLEHEGGGSLFIGFLLVELAGTLHEAIVVDGGARVGVGAGPLPEQQTLGLVVHHDVRSVLLVLLLAHAQLVGEISGPEGVGILGLPSQTVEVLDALESHLRVNVLGSGDHLELGEWLGRGEFFILFLATVGLFAQVQTPHGCSLVGGAHLESSVLAEVELMDAVVGLVGGPARSRDI
jgi:hypothetical protein